MKPSGEEHRSFETPRDRNANGALAPPRGCKVPLSGIFAIQLLIVVGAFAGITAMFVVGNKAQIDQDVTMIVTTSLVANANLILNPIREHKRTSTTVGTIIAQNAMEYQTQHLDVNNISTLAYQWALFRANMVHNSFQLYGYSDYDTGIPSPLDTSVNIILSSICSQHACYAINETGDTMWLDIPANVAMPRAFNFSAARVTDRGVVVGAYDYLKTSMTTSSEDGLWAVPYTWVEASNTYILISYFRCLAWNTTSGGCRATYGQDFDLGYVTSIIGTFGSTPESQVFLVDFQGDTVLASNVVPALDENGAMWGAEASPSSTITDVVRRFKASCPTLVGCAPLVDVSGSNIVAALQIAPFPGVNMLLADVSPRSHYYETADGRQRIGVAIVVIVSAIAIFVCVMIFVGISRPMETMIAAFSLAAVMKNDLVVPTSSSILEVDKLSMHFDRMNDKLMAARAFMPQSMLVDDDDGSLSDEDGDEGNVEIGSDECGSRVSSMPRTGKSKKQSIVASTVNGTVDDSQRSRSRSSSKSKTARADRFVASELSDRKCTILVVNIVGTHDMVQQIGAASLEHGIGVWITRIQAAAKHEKGIVDTFHGDRVVVTFNSSNVVAAHPRRAALCALEIAKASTDDKLFAGSKQFPVLSMGIATGRALTGNLGSATLKAFTTLGRVYSDAMQLERFARNVSRRDGATTILTTEMCLEDMSVAAYTYPMGTCAGIIGGTAYAVAARIEHSAEDEWLYELDAASSNDPYFGVRTGINAVIRGDIAAAAAVVAAREARRAANPSLQESPCVQRAWGVLNGIMVSKAMWNLTQ